MLEYFLPIQITLMILLEGFLVRLMIGITKNPSRRIIIGQDLSRKIGLKYEYNIEKWVCQFYIQMGPSYVSRTRSSSIRYIMAETSDHVSKIMGGRQNNKSHTLLMIICILRGNNFDILWYRLKLHCILPSDSARYASIIKCQNYRL